ncbi:MAG TPA: maleylpyruvate isomerase family mycothiol-dependent enzyme [Ilumatobacteraceae bacterium]|nr:maleylpyruvate isomerase family mycothiol-dependent enzyme [Ilumatobacteraceae bacterium]
MSESPGIAELYRLAHASFNDFALTLSDDDWRRPVPCTPEWTARDVLSHVSGIPDDAVAGRMEGAPGDDWTAAQVERNRDARVDELLDRWSEQASGFAEVIESTGEMRPPFDLHSHEHDLRHALGRPGERSSLIVETAGIALASVGDVGVRVTVELDDGRAIVSGDAANTSTVTLCGVSVFELFRSRLGRRSREQVRSYDWTGSDNDIDAVLGRWFNFGPSPLPIDE